MFSIGLDKPLPMLRPDIEIFSGPLEEDGSPVYVIHDPVSGSFSKIGWAEAAVLKRLNNGRTLPALVREINEETTLKVDAEDVSLLCEDARQLGLTTDSLIKPPALLMETAKRKKKSLPAWLAQHYLYFRIPLVHPDAFLGKTLPIARLLVSSAAKWIYFLSALVGLYFLTQQFENFISTFSYFYNFEGVVVFTLIIVVLKCAHELGHAYVAKSYGLRVPTMGVAFMVFFPVAFSDVTDAWRLRRRGERLRITTAGVMVELVIGAMALALWGMTQPGIVNSACFLLSSTTVISTLVINLNPAMRYDGYYLLSDLWGIDNLSEQSTQYTKWRLRQILLGMDAPCPLSKVSRKRGVRMFFYAFYAWHYRFFLYLGIAVVVYHKFTKPLGVFLFCLEIFLFIIRPALLEIKMLIKEKHRIRMNLRLLLTMLVVLILTGWAVLALPRRSSAPAVYLPVQSQTIYASESAQIVKVLKKKGDTVAAGDVLIEMASSALDSQLEELTVRISQLRHDFERAEKSPDQLGLVPQIQKQLASAEAEKAGLMARKNQLRVTAQTHGVVAELDEAVQPGSFVAKDQMLGYVTSLDEARIEAFVSEKEINNIIVGKDVVFFPVDRTRPIAGKIVRVSPIRVEDVQRTDIGAVAAEELPLVKDEFNHTMTFVESYYKIHIAPKIDPDAGLPHIRLGTGGHVRFETVKQSLVLEFAEHAYSVIIRESGF